jgi:hypothetical protein
MRPDIFADSRNVMLRNDVLDALHRRHVGDTREAWQRLAGEFPDDGSLPGLASLIEVLEEGVATPFMEHATLAQHAVPRILAPGIGTEAAVAALRGASSLGLDHRCLLESPKDLRGHFGNKSPGSHRRTAKIVA